MHAEQIRFLVLRYSSAYSPLESEIDLLVPPRSKDAFVQSFLSGLHPSCKCIGFKSGVTGIRVLLADISNDGQVTTVTSFALDIRELIVKDGAILADYHEVEAAGRSEQDDLPVPAPAVQSALLIARNVWARRALSPRHHDILKRGWTADATRLANRFLVRAEGDDYASAVSNAIRMPVPPLRNAANPITRGLVFVRHVSLSRVSSRRPSVLVLYGPDGVGKTTTAAAVASVLRAGGVRTVAQHYSDSLIDESYLTREGQKVISVPAARPRASLWSRVKRVVLFPARHVQFALDIRRKTSSDVVVYDRFCFDHLFKGDAALDLSQATRVIAATVFRAMRPRRGVVNVMLELDPAEIHERKPEMAFDRIKDYYECGLIYCGDDLERVDASGNQQAVCAAVSLRFLQAIDMQWRRDTRRRVHPSKSL